MTTSDGVPFRFGKDSSGNYGYILNQGGADTVIPFKKGGFSKAIVKCIWGYQTTIGNASGTGDVSGTGNGVQLLDANDNILMATVFGSSYSSGINVDVLDTDLFTIHQNTDTYTFTIKANCTINGVDYTQGQTMSLNRNSGTILTIVRQ